ncbi:hypothetical protein ACFC0M_00615 [Streptomyces sp. NPDC056149]
MTDNDKPPAVEQVEDKLADEVVERLKDRANAQEHPCWAEVGC